MENFEFIESGIIFGIKDRLAFRKFRYSSKDFAKHGDAFKFVTTYFDKYGEFPSAEILCENYPTLDPSAQSLNLDYALDVFQKQILYRQIVGAFQTNKELIGVEPKQALSKIMTSLSDIEIVYDEDVTEYNKKPENRLDSWKTRKELRQKSGGMIGIHKIAGGDVDVSSVKIGGWFIRWDG